VFDLYLRWLATDGWKLLVLAVLIDVAIAGIAYLCGERNE